MIKIQIDCEGAIFDISGKELLLDQVTNVPYNVLLRYDGQKSFPVTVKLTTKEGVLMYENYFQSLHLVGKIFRVNKFGHIFCPGYEIPVVIPCILEVSYNDTLAMGTDNET